MELGHMAERVDTMLESVPAAFRTRDFREVAQLHDQVVVLREAVLQYLQHVGRANLTDVESDEHAKLVYATGEIESISTVIGRDLAPIAKIFREADITVSQATGTLFEQLYEATRETARFGLQAIAEKNERADSCRRRSSSPPTGKAGW